MGGRRERRRAELVCKPFNFRNSQSTSLQAAFSSFENLMNLLNNQLK